MNQKEIIQKIKDGNYIDLINSIYQNHSLSTSDFFLFKSKNNDTFYLGFNQPTTIPENDLKNQDGPFAIIGNFETFCTYKYFDQYLYFKNGTLESKINFDFIPQNIIDESSNLVDIEYNTSESAWEKMVNSALELIHSNQFSKIVLSRDVTYSFDFLNPVYLIKRLLNENNRAKDSFLIISKTNNTWNISLTPELLFEMENGLIRSVALAGSLPNTNNQEVNAQNEQLLLNDEKLTLEHSIVTKEIVSNFETICEKFEVSPVNILKLDYIQHRLQTIVGKLKHKIKINDILRTLHPTPAVGTMPKENGIKIINSLENRKRDFYASPCGIYYKKSSEVAVMLRSATLQENKLILHTGCGITAGSVAKNEWLETENKTMPFKRLFQRQ